MKPDRLAGYAPSMQAELLDLKLPPAVGKAAEAVLKFTAQGGELFERAKTANLIDETLDTLAIVRVACWAVIAFCVVVGIVVIGRRP